MRALLLTGVAAGALVSGVVVASAADVRAPVRIVAPAPVPDWSGHYFGLSLGWGQARGTLTDTGGQFVGDGSQSVDPANAFLLGGKLGYNFGGGLGHSLILGVEADVTGVFGEDATCTGAVCSITTPSGGPALGYNLQGLGSLVGRLGWANPRSMFYLLAGVATGAVTTKEWVGAAAVEGSSHLFMGWTAGLGMDVMAAPKVSWGIEGRYYDLGSKTLTAPGSTTAVAWHPIAWTFTVGTKYHF